MTYIQSPKKKDGKGEIEARGEEKEKREREVDEWCLRGFPVADPLVVMTCM